MKNIVYNNIKLMGLKWYMVLLLYVVIAIVSVTVNLTSFFIPIIYLLTGLFPLLFIANHTRNNGSNWKKLELVMPFTRKKIVISNYVTFLLSVFLGVTFGIIFTLGQISRSFLIWETDYFSLVLLGVGIIISMYTFFYPLLLYTGEDKAELSLMISLFLCVLPLRLFMEIVTRVMDLDNITQLHNYGMFYIMFLSIVLLCFVISCGIAIQLFNNKEF